MAPEQLAGTASDARADQFTFCVALWEALAGERPFGGGSRSSCCIRRSRRGGSDLRAPSCDPPPRIERRLAPRTGRRSRREVSIDAGAHRRAPGGASWLDALVAARLHGGRRRRARRHRAGLRATAAWGRRSPRSRILLADGAHRAASSRSRCPGRATPAWPRSSAGVPRTRRPPDDLDVIIVVGWNDVTSSVSSVSELVRRNAYALAVGPIRSGIRLGSPRIMLPGSPPARTRSRSRSMRARIGRSVRALEFSGVALR